MNDRTTPTTTITIQVPSTAPKDVISRVTALGAQGGIDQVLLELVRTCHVCGCTDERACFGGCWWVNDDGTPDLCSSCEDRHHQ